MSDAFCLCKMHIALRCSGFEPKAQKRAKLLRNLTLALAFS
jgi:hypothetical protein